MSRLSVDYTPTSGSGASLPSNASGFLHNDGAGALAWQAAGGGFPSANADTATTGALQVGKHHYISAAGGNVSRALPATATAGDLILLEKADSSVNTVSATGSIRGVGSATFTLKLANESILFEADGANSWWPMVGHKTLTSQDTRYMTVVNHGSSAAVTRPASVGTALWIGSVVPGFPILDDLWDDKSTSPAVLRRYNGTSFESVGGTSSGGNPTPTVSSMTYPQPMGHRGGANMFPENSLEGFEGCDALGVQSVKFDIMGTADGAQVLMHDTTMDRTTDASGTVASMTVPGVKRANITPSKFFSSKYPTLKVPTLQEVLDRLVYSNLILSIEPKVAGANQINKLAAAAGARGIKSKILIQTFISADIATASANGMQSMFLTQNADPVTTQPPATVVGYGATHIGIRYSSLTAGLSATITAYKAVGLRVWFWTLDRQMDYDAIIAAGADGAMSNDPVYVARQYSNYRTTRTSWDLDGTWPAGVQASGAQVSGNPQNNGTNGRGDIVGQPGGYRLSVPSGVTDCIGQISPVANAASSYTLTFVFDFDTIGTASSFLGCCFAVSTDNMGDTASGVLKTGYNATIRQNGQLVLWSSNGTSSSTSLGTATTTVPQVISLTSTLVAGTAVTSIPVQATTVALKVGHQVKLSDGSVATLTAAAAIGATALTVSSVTPAKTITSAVILATGPTASTTITTLQVQPIATALLDGQLLNLGNGQIATVSGDQPAGSTNIPIASLLLNATAISSGATLYTVLPVRATIVVTVSPTTVTAQRGDETSVSAISVANTDWRGGYVAIRNNVSQSSGMGVNTVESVTVS